MASEQYDRVAKALAHIANGERMAMAILHYYDPRKDAMNSVVFSSNAAAPLATAVLMGVDKAADSLGIEIQCECGCEEGNPISESGVSVQSLLDDDEGDRAA